MGGEEGVIWMRGVFSSFFCDGLIVVKGWSWMVGKHGVWGSLNYGWAVLIYPDGTMYEGSLEFRQSAIELAVTIELIPPWEEMQPCSILNG